MGRGLSDLQKRILIKAIEGRAAVVKEQPDEGIGRWMVTLRVPLDADAVKAYFDALARYRRWKKEPLRMRMELAAEEGEGDPFGPAPREYVWDDDTLAVLFCGLESAVNCIDRDCGVIRCRLPERLKWPEGQPELWNFYRQASASPAYVCTYDFNTTAEAESFREENAQAVAELADRPGATLEVDEGCLASWPDLLVKDAVLLAGRGERSTTAEAVASRAIARLERRGLVATGRAKQYGIWFPRALWLTGAGLGVAAGLAPDIAERREDAARQEVTA